MKRGLVNFTKSEWLVIILHFILTVTLYYILKFFGVITQVPNDVNLAIYDAGWLRSIVEKGYFFSNSGQSSVAFFPLFPLLWKATGLGAIGISFLNYLIFLVGCGLLSNLYTIDKRLLLLFLSLPSLIFCFLPYTEAVFFFSCALMIYGLKKSHWLGYLGIFLACFSRSASLVFVPIVIILKAYNLIGKDSLNVRSLVNGVLLILSATVSTLLVNYYQYVETGKFFAIFEATHFWYREFGLPQLFFTTWDSGRLIWLDGLALFCGLVCVFISLSLLVRKLKRPSRTLPEDLLFSIGYISATVLSTVIYTGEDAAGGSTLMSLNRYVFATPFFFVLMIYNAKLNSANWTHRIFWFVIISMINWSMFDFFGELNGMGGIDSSKTATKIYFGVVFSYGLGFFLMGQKELRRKFWSGYYIFNLIVQLILFNFFMKGVWIG